MTKAVHYNMVGLFKKIQIPALGGVNCYEYLWLQRKPNYSNIHCTSMSSPYQDLTEKLGCSPKSHIKFEFAKPFLLLLFLLM